MLNPLREQLIMKLAQHHRFGSTLSMESIEYVVDVYLRELSPPGGLAAVHEAVQVVVAEEQ